MIRSLSFALFLFAVAAPGLAQIDAAFEPPRDDDFDWIQLTSGEWLKGEIIALYDEDFQFESDILDVLELDMGDVQQIRSAGVVQLGFREGGTVAGRVELDGDTVRIFDGDEELEFERADLLSMTAGPPTEASYWSSKITLGATLRSGNTDQTEFTGWARALRRAPLNRLGLEYLGNYNETESVKVANNHRLTAKWDRFLAERIFYTPVNFEWYKDPFLNIDNRWTYSLGIGYQIIDTPKTSWSVTVGPGYQYIEFVDVEEGQDRSTDTWVVAVGSFFDRELTDDLDFNWDYSFYFLDEEAGEYTHHMTAGFTIDLTRIIDLDLAAVWDRVEKPQPGADGVIPEQDDFRFVVGVGFDF